MKTIFSFIIISFLFAFIACKTSLQGELNLNTPPETYTIADTINRQGNDRLNSQVQVQWWGDDDDGFITAFEFTFDSIITDQTDWHYTTRQDTVFLLATPPDKDSIDFHFHVRAIDNKGLRDPSPADLIYPVKNSLPAVSFIYAEKNPLSSFPVLRYYWEGNDPDGTENIKGYELCWNDTSMLPYFLDLNVTSAIFEATSVQTNLPDCAVYINNNQTAQSQLMSGLVLNDTNILYIRAVDNANARSVFAASKKVFVKKPVSDILLVNGYTSNGASVENFYATQMALAGFDKADTLKLFEKLNGAYTQQSPDVISQSKLFALFNVIIWFTNDASNSLSLGQRTLNDFFNAGGKLFMAVYISSLFDEKSGFLDFTPIQSLTVPADTTLLLTDTSRLFNLQSEYPELKSSAFVGVVRPFIPVTGATPIYNAQLIAKDNATLQLSNFTGNSIVMAKKTDALGATNFVISTIELQKLNANKNVSDFFQVVMKYEFGL